MNLLQKQLSTTQRVLIFGAPKSGKTQLAGSLAKEFNLYWFDLENGYSTLLKLPSDLQKNINLISLPDTRSYPIAIETMLKVIKGGEHKICDTHGKINCPACMIEVKKAAEEGREVTASFTVIDVNKFTPNDVLVVDSLTQLTNSAIANITKNEPDDYKMQFDDWGNLGKLMDIFLSHVQQAKYNVVCISHESEAELEDGKKKIVPVAGTRNFSRNTAKYFDHVIYTEMKNKKHMAGSATDYAVNVLTGSRTDVKLEGLPEANLLAFFKPSALPAVADSKVNTQGVQAQQNLAEKLAAMKAGGK